MKKTRKMILLILLTMVIVFLCLGIAVYSSGALNVTLGDDIQITSIDVLFLNEPSAVRMDYAINKYTYQNMQDNSNEYVLCFVDAYVENPHRYNLCSWIYLGNIIGCKDWIYRSGNESLSTVVPAFSSNYTSIQIIVKRNGMTDEEITQKIQNLKIYSFGLKNRSE